MPAVRMDRLPTTQVRDRVPLVRPRQRVPDLPSRRGETMNCVWCVNPVKGKQVALIDPPQSLVLCRDCQAIARREGRL